MAIEPERLAGPIKILVVDDAADAREVLQTHLEDAGYAVRTCAGVEEALQALDRGVFDVIITDLRMPKANGLELIQHVRANLQDVEIMMVTGYPSIEGAVEAVKTGAEHYLAKPFTEQELLQAVEAIVDKLSRKRLAHGSANAGSTHGIVGASSAMQHVFKSIDKAGGNTATVLIAGESGTGKELVARAIHYAGPRRTAPFVSVNCTAIPENLIESELFGHVKGAFTGAGNTRAGFFEIAEGGTLFLDEIGDASLAMQGKLLRAIQEKTIYKVGSSRAVQVDTRLIVATNKHLPQLIDKGLFREDLYYRINVIDIPLPPLRERGDDLLLLVNHFHDRFAKDLDRPVPVFSDEALRQLMAYHWPGNIRELENLMQKLVLMCEGARIESVDLPPQMRAARPVARRLDYSLAEYEAEYIREVLDSVQGNKTKAAAILKIDRKTLREKINGRR
ncbi:MAG: sigma-54 dependent transcriptional regulator [Desulfobulbus sp.]|jgi:DNA-binding NtrC family response regulator|uniref:sigma-54-dependent transcriptional regulator n=1 Tax=Desulfobulbus sp. TaxID=895 RepID=UPI0028497C07|nr:sigma-54 dependent transcriptional regulator [Desulfobulbus sp.]MDR2549797.1 sigma-54 dependent transcriptional regulator [Desulfobulbus sp.]